MRKAVDLVAKQQPPASVRTPYFESVRLPYLVDLGQYALLGLLEALLSAVDHGEPVGVIVDLEIKGGYATECVAVGILEQEHQLARLARRDIVIVCELVDLPYGKIFSLHLLCQ